MTRNYTPTLLSLQNRSIYANADFADFADSADFADFADFRYPRTVSEIHWRGWNMLKQDDTM